MNDKKFDKWVLKIIPLISFCIGVTFGLIMSFFDKTFFGEGFFIDLLIILFCGLFGFLLYFGLFGIVAVIGTIYIMSEF